MKRPESSFLLADIFIAYFCRLGIWNVRKNNTSRIQFGISINNICYVDNAASLTARQVIIEAKKERAEVVIRSIPNLTETK